MIRHYARHQYLKEHWTDLKSVCDTERFVLISMATAGCSAMIGLCGVLVNPFIGLGIIGLALAFWIVAKVEEKDMVLSHSEKTMQTVQMFKQQKRFFKSLFGRSPEWLGIKGTAKVLTRCATAILRAEAIGLDTRGLRNHFKTLMNTAAMFMPVPSYEDIFAAAKAGKKCPDKLPEFED